jgi:hypothetical protein
LYRLGRNGLADAQTGRAARDDFGELLVPVPAAELHPVGGDLPCPAHVGVHQGIVAAAVRRLFGNGDERCRLRRQERQRNRADAVDLQPRCEDLAAARGEEIAGAADVPEEFGQVLGKIAHGLRSRGLIEGFGRLRLALSVRPDAACGPAAARSVWMRASPKSSTAASCGRRR